MVMICLVQKYWTAYTQSMHMSSHTPSLNFSLQLAVANFVSVCLGESTERSYTHANWYTKVRCGSESLTNAMLLWAKNSCWRNFM